MNCTAILLIKITNYEIHFTERLTTLFLQYKRVVVAKSI